MNRHTIPASEEAEKSLVAAALLDLPHTMNAAARCGITKESFFFERYALPWEVLAEHFSQNKPIDVIILTQKLRDRASLAKAGGVAEITGLSCFLPTAANAKAYAETIREKQVLREIIAGGTNLLEEAYAGEDVPTMLDKAQGTLLNLVQMSRGEETHARSMRELAIASVSRVQEAVEGKQQWPLRSGIPALDKVIGGFRAPEVIVICGKSSDGKSALALNFVEEAAINSGKKVGVISLEMSDEQCTDRLLMAIARMDIRSLKMSGKISDHDLTRIAAAASKLADASIFIRDDGQLTMAEIGATLSQWKTQHGLDLAVIDHAQLVKGSAKARGRTEEVEEISRALKPLAKRLQIPIIVLSQVVEEEGELKTKNSRALTEDADKVLAISHTENGSWILVGKNRDGERNKSIPVSFVASIQRFIERTHEEEERAMPQSRAPKKRWGRD